MPVRWRIMVDLPAPLGPTRPYTAPVGTVMLMSSRARKPSNSFMTFLTSIMGLFSFQSLNKLRLINANVTELGNKLVKFTEKLFFSGLVHAVLCADEAALTGL